MATFTIDTDNNITAHATVPANTEHQVFSSAKELAKLAAEWPAPRLIEVWNSFAGVAPFDDLKPVKKFPNRKAAVTRIWGAVTRLSPDVAPQAATVAPVAAKSKKSAPKGKKRDTARKGASESGTNKKAEVIALMQRSKGVTLDEIMSVTGWQRHTIRGFVSILGSKGGHKVESTKTDKGERIYRIAK